MDGTETMICKYFVQVRHQKHVPKKVNNFYTYRRTRGQLVQQRARLFIIIPSNPPPYGSSISKTKKILQIEISFYHQVIPKFK